jgi:hypothetical protein
MLLSVLQDIEERFNGFLSSQGGQEMVLGDIAKHNVAQGNPDAGSIENHLVLTLVSIEEESTLKNNYPITQQNSALTSQKPTLYLNLYLLFTAHFDLYDEALKHLGYVLLFFQTHTKISYTDTFGNTYNLTFSLHNTGFESLHNLWTVLGGSAKPSVVYKARLIFVQESPAVGGNVITQIQSNENIQ